ncbi:type I-E CRISPR-associated protein Cas5/CasD [Stappia sp.]|uniref:type I-E CRISPR-associated protein Cas5/CasD n=1 Tax=Stappia sp. TaxID=1870903 RepID=UPI003D131874
MTDWLVVTLAGPMASFGEEAGNAQRSTADRPSRSALTGLAGAALGILRDDAEGQRRLARAFRVATWTLQAGTLLSDFHTYQSLPGPAGRPATRAEALKRRSDLATSITRREYRSDVLYLAGFRSTGAGAPGLADLQEAFRQPVFTLCLGRRSCPLSRPLSPRTIHAETATDAFRAYVDEDASLLRRGRAAGTLAGETMADLGESNEAARAHMRRDEPGDRRTWQFSSRREFVRHLAVAAVRGGEGDPA